MKKLKEKSNNKKIKDVVIITIIVILVVILMSLIVRVCVELIKDYRLTKELNMVYGGASLEDLEYNIKEKSKENPELDTDGDGLTNVEEDKIGTRIMDSDTDGDGLTDYEEVRKYGSDPTKYSTSDDEISDYIKVMRGLDVNKKYKRSEIKPGEVVVNDHIVLKPKDLESEFYGGIEEFNYDKISTFPIFDVLDFEGTIEYDTKDKNSIVVIKDGKTDYIKYRNYKNKNGKLIIKVTEKDNYKDFVITTKEKLDNK